MTDDDIVKLLKIYCPDVPAERIKDIFCRAKEECSKHPDEQFMEDSMYVL